MISPKSFAWTTTSPSSKFSISTFFSILKSKSEAAIVSIPSEVTFNKIPFRIGIVVLAVTAFETTFKAFAKLC